MSWAFCFSGQLRQPSNLEFIRDRLVGCVGNRDIFVHTWKPKGVIYSSWGTLQSTEYGMDTFSSAILPCAFREDDYETSPVYEAFMKDKRSGGFLSMAYGMKQTFLIMDEHRKANNVNYDVVVRCRSDYKFSAELPHEQIAKLLAENPENRVVIPDGNDQIAFCSGQTACKYFGWFDRILESAEKLGGWHPETMLKYYLKDLMQLEIVRIDLGQQSLVR